MANISEFQLPREMKTFHNTFKQMFIHADPATVFKDFLTLMIGYYAYGRGMFQQEYDQALLTFEGKKKREILKVLATEVININYEKFVKQKVKWFDLFGIYYQYLASEYQQKSLGQYFTPEPICELLVNINMISQAKPLPRRPRVSDMACGSGRMLIAAHTSNPASICYGTDVDEICCKMAVLNLMFHGAQGEIRQANTLDIGDYRRGWLVNAYLLDPKIGLPGIQPLTRKESFQHAADTQFLETRDKEREQELRQAMQSQSGQPERRIARPNLAKIHF